MFGTCWGSELCYCLVCECVTTRDACCFIRLSKLLHVLNVTHAAAPCDRRSCFETGSPRSGALTHFTPRSVATCVFTATAGKHKHFHWEAENGISRKPHLWHVEMTFLTWGSLTQAMIWCRSCRAKPKQWNYLKKVQNRWVNKKCHKLIKVL